MTCAYLVDSVMFVEGTFWAWSPEYCREELGDLLCVFADEMFSGMIAPEKPPLRIA